MRYQTALCPALRTCRRPPLASTERGRASYGAGLGSVNLSPPVPDRGVGRPITTLSSNPRFFCRIPPVYSLLAPNVKLLLASTGAGRAAATTGELPSLRASRRAAPSQSADELAPRAARHWCGIIA